MILKLNDLPKVSLNQWYASSHWSKRVKLKNTYKVLIRSQLGLFKPFSKDQKYETEYNFMFKTKPLDASNTIAMVKLIEDTIFEDDRHDIIKSVKMTSEKSNENSVTIKITEL